MHDGSDKMSEIGKVVSVHIGTRDDMSKQSHSEVKVDHDGFEGDNHQGHTRTAYEGDKDPEGTVRRNERQWSGVSFEELVEVTQSLRISSPLLAEDLGANLCISGIEQFSALPGGTRLKFSSGAILCIAEFNPPCMDMGEKLSGMYKKADGGAFEARDFVLAAKRRRGVVGVVDVPGTISEGDEVVVERLWVPDF